MKMGLTAGATLAFLVTACGDTANTPDRQPIGADGQDQVCAARLAEELGRPLSDIRANARDTAPSGNSIVFIQTADGTVRANCEITDFGDIVAFNRSDR